LFQGQVVAITGAGSGLGRAIAVRFARAGAAILASDRIGERLESLRAGLHTLGAECVTILGDVTDEAHGIAITERANSSWGRLDVLCNCAGISDGATPADEMETELWQRVIAINLTGTFLVTRAALPLMLRERSGLIVNISSIAGLVSISGPAYSASKHGVIGLTKSIAATYREDGIRCVAICPGLIPTALTQNVAYASSPRAIRRGSYRANRPSPGTPEQIAEIAMFLASDGGRHINGTEIIADGGFLAS
jgi:NAD(P)-dependent dehydrogenase (short-subunit alcohol dehydrogenase family)